jgi:A/G-specific adenine glycosylase
MTCDSNFSSQIIDWQKKHGRHDLPWQNTRDPYAIWVSEIMLQQTQVSAVKGYYGRFMDRFPTILDLANADIDNVLEYWSGLGYYARARNLHEAAQQIRDHWGGQFPQNREAIQALPGIGRSTAAAIACFSFNQSEAILDGNVKRVLCRYFCIQGDPSSSSVLKELWSKSEALVPKDNIIAYTQGLMDLGASVCSRHQPACQQCPLMSTCRAFNEGMTDKLPTPKPKKSQSTRKTQMLIATYGEDVFLQKRPPQGIWGGLWSFPEVSVQDDLMLTCSQWFGNDIHLNTSLPVYRHTFTHFILEIHPVHIRLMRHPRDVENREGVWLNRQEALGAAIATPIRRLLLQLDAYQHEDNP